MHDMLSTKMEGEVLRRFPIRQNRKILTKTVLIMTMTVIWLMVILVMMPLMLMQDELHHYD